MQRRALNPSALLLLVLLAPVGCDKLGDLGDHGMGSGSMSDGDDGGQDGMQDDGAGDGMSGGGEDSATSDGGMSDGGMDDGGEPPCCDPAALPMCENADATCCADGSWACGDAMGQCEMGTVCEDPNACPSGQNYYVRGCEFEPEGVGFMDGCYQACMGLGDDSCGAGTSCQLAHVDPCYGQMCEACGADAWLCLPDGGGEQCPMGTEYFAPGCGPVEPPIEELPAAGCYQACVGPMDLSCGPGSVCESTWVNPCLGLECDACGGEQWLCSTPSACEDGQIYAESSCEQDELFHPEPGCYTECDPQSQSCNDSEACVEAYVDSACTEMDCGPCEGRAFICVPV